MPRPTRVHLPGALYVITSRAMEGGSLFRDTKDYETFLAFLQGYREEFGFKLFAYVLLPDSLQLCLELTGSTTVSEIMHAINSRYTKYYLKRYSHTGHLFQERFKATLMEKAPSLLRLTGYLHTLPLRLGLVRELRAYRWSSYLHYLPAAEPQRSDAAGRQAPVLWPLDGAAHEVQNVLARQHPGLTYEAYVQGVSEQEWEQLRAELQRPVVGSPAFLALAKQRAATQWRAEDSRAAVGSAAATQEERSVGAARTLRREPNVMLTASMALAFLAICTAGLYAKNLSALRDTIGALVYERTVQFRGMPETASTAAVATLAAFHLPLQLEGAEADVEIQSISGTADPLIQKERLEFRDGKLVSRALGAQGFSPSKYTVTRRESEIIVWETVQADKRGTFIYWRGEWDGQTVRGTLTRHLPGRVRSTYSFVGATTPPHGRSGRMKEI